MLVEHFVSLWLDDTRDSASSDCEHGGCVVGGGRGGGGGGDDMFHKTELMLSKCVLQSMGNGELRCMVCCEHGGLQPTSSNHTERVGMDCDAPDAPTANRSSSAIIRFVILHSTFFSIGAGSN